MKKNILLIHGWDYELYTKMTNNKDAWEDYKKFINKLESNYNLYKINLPGFCGEEEPRDTKWSVLDFANYVDNYIKSNNIDVDIVIGYSFGGAVSVKWKVVSGSKAKLFLIAPAIIRNNSNSKKFIKTPKFLDGIRDVLRDFYVINIVKNNEMKYGTKFLRNTYQVIVREDLRSDLEKIDPKDIKIIYGSNDNAVAPQELINSVSNLYKVVLVEDADHDNILLDDKYIDCIDNELNKIL